MTCQKSFLKKRIEKERKSVMPYKLLNKPKHLIGIQFWMLAFDCFSLLKETTPNQGGRVAMSKEAAKRFWLLFRRETILIFNPISLHSLRFCPPFPDVHRVILSLYPISWRLLFFSHFVIFWLRKGFFLSFLFPISCASLSLFRKQKKGQKSLLWSWLFFHAFCFRYKMDLFNSLLHLHFWRILLFLLTPNQSHICSSFIISTSITIDVRWWLDGSKFNHHRSSIESLSRNMEMSCCCCCWLGFNSRMSCGRKAYHSHPSQRWNSGRKMAHRGEKTREKNRVWRWHSHGYKSLWHGVSVIHLGILLAGPPAVCRREMVWRTDRTETSAAINSILPSPSTIGLAWLPSPEKAKKIKM